MEPYRGYGRGMYGRGMKQYDAARRSQNGCSNSSCTNAISADCGARSSGCGCGEADLDRSIYSDSSNCCNECGSRSLECGCMDDNKHMRSMPLAIGFVKLQEWEQLYNSETALQNGTSFPCLNLIFCGARGKM